MYYIFNNKNKCIATSNVAVNEDDLLDYGNFAKQSDIICSELSKIYLHNDQVCISEDSLESSIEETKQQIMLLKNKLAKTDYVVIKIAEGLSSSEDYKSILEERKEWRAQINQLEQLLSGGMQL